MSLPKPYYDDGKGIVIYHADCRDIMPLLSGLVVSDPPYNVGYHYETYSDNLSPEEYQELINKACPRPCVLIHYTEDLFDFSVTFGETPKRIVDWVYPSNTARQWRGIAWWGAEPDFTLDGQPYRNPEDKRIQERMANGKAARLYDWWEINQVKNVSDEKTDHPCQIPESVMKRILKITPFNGPIIDPFMGSGTTLLAAKELGRSCIGIERDEKYCEIAASRLQQEFFPIA